MYLIGNVEEEIYHECIQGLNKRKYQPAEFAAAAWARVRPSSGSPSSVMVSPDIYLGFYSLTSVVPLPFARSIETYRFFSATRQDVSFPLFEAFYRLYLDAAASYLYKQLLEHCISIVDEHQCLWLPDAWYRGAIPRGQPSILMGYSCRSLVNLWQGDAIPIAGLE
jgi:hypothetical protein